MPELPEVETVKESLKLRLNNKKIIRTKVLWDNIIAYPSKEKFIKETANQSINDVKRRGKFLLFDLDDYYLLSHLRMEGKYFFKTKDDDINKHEHVIFDLDDGSELRYMDTRKFGKMYLIKKEDINKIGPLVKLGLEPWDDNLTSEYLLDKYKKKKLPIKSVLLDQNIIVGIGNIYADEILFLSKINPLKKCNLITKEEAVLRIDPVSFDKLLLPAFDKDDLAKATVVAEGLAAGPGAGTGKIAFTAEEAERRHAEGEKVILARAETSPEDIVGMVAAEGILTMRGGMTSHAAVVARGMGKCCVCGCKEALIDEEARTVTINGKVYTDKDVISLDGSTGKVYLGDIKKVMPDLSAGYFGRLMQWVDEARVLKVRTNADTPRDAKQAKEFGAEGIGLCRTEHMFFDKDRIFSMRKMILADTVEERRAALAELEPMQQSDFESLYETMGEMNVNVRLLDPPLHEFLPTEEDKIAELAKATNRTVEQVKARIEYLHEFNPMMGHRGCRLAVSYPEICEMQTNAIIKAALNVQKRTGVKIEPEIMVPLVLEVKELKFVKKIIAETADKLIAESGQKMTYHVGTMIEIPRAALLADEIAEEAEFFSFGTNDLTQMTFGFSRDDAAKFLPDYYEHKIFEEDPFKTLDQHGVGKLVQMAVKGGRSTNAHLHIGVCGETGGEPNSIEFYHKAGLDYVSCSPFRVPVARLAAAQAAIKNPRK